MIITIKVSTNKQVNKIIKIENINGENIVIVHISASPEKGRANKHIIDLFSKVLSMPKKNISIICGKTKNIKNIKIEGWKNEFYNLLGL